MLLVRLYKGFELYKYSLLLSFSYFGKGNLKMLCIIFIVSIILLLLNYLKELGFFLLFF